MRGPFSQEDADTVRPLLRHVRRALEIKDRFTARGIHAGALNSVIDSLSFGVVVLDQTGKVIETSSAALCHLNDVCATPPQFRAVLAFNEPFQREFQTLLSSDLCRGRLADGLLHIPRGPQRLPLAILLGPAPAVAQSWLLNTPHWLLFVFDPERRVVPVAAFLEKDLLLTEREAQIAAELAAGLQPSQIASRLKISMNTLRAHLKACFAKTGCRSQSELVSRIIASPGWALSSTADH
jgi:DNA-binding CsgD family transcriptional regulator